MTHRRLRGGRSGRIVIVVVAVIASTVGGWPRLALGAPAVRLVEVAAIPGSAVPLPHPSSHLGVRWRGADDDLVELRWRGAARRWSEWRTVAVSHDLGDEASGVILSGLISTTDATAAEVRVVAGSPRAIEVVAIDTAHGPRPLVRATESSLASAAPSADARVAQPPVISRAEWGADESMRTGTPAHADITRMSVHHTVTEEGSDPAATIRAIYAYHTRSNGWHDLGYNFIVDSAGRVYEGRYAQAYEPGVVPTGEDAEGRGVIGAHTANNNTGTVGVALLGDFSQSPPPRPAQEVLVRLLAWKADRHRIDPLATTMWSTGERPTVIGHRDAVATACPGDAFYSLLGGVRQAVADAVAAAHAATTTSGYWVLARDTALYAFGDAAFMGGPFVVPGPAASLAATPTGKGYWILSAGGRVTPFGDALLLGSTELLALNAPVVRLEPTRTGRGYWVLGADGGVFAFGDALFVGSTGAMKLNAPVVSIAATPTGRGYWLLAADGGIFAFGDAGFFGSTGAMKLNAPVASMAPHSSGKGYWLQGRDGGIFSFGESRYLGSVPGLSLPGPPAATVALRATATGAGYYVLATGGGIFAFGDAGFHGAYPGLTGDRSAVDLAIRTSPK